MITECDATKWKAAETHSVAFFAPQAFKKHKIRQYNGKKYINFAITMENFTDGLYPTRFRTAIAE